MDEVGLCWRGGGGNESDGGAGGGETGRERRWRHQRPIGDLQQSEKLDGKQITSDIFSPLFPVTSPSCFFSWLLLLLLLLMLLMLLQMTS